jgi:hypothetical protein
MVGAGSCPQGPGCISIYGKCGYAKIRNGDKIGEKSEKNRGWLGDDVGGVCFRIQGTFPYMESVAMQK